MFESAKLKVDRAKQHIRNLRTTLNSYSQSARLEFGPEGSFITVTIDSGAEPTCSLIIGDAVHNLRAALEHAFWELMEIDGGVQDHRTSFPVCRGSKTDYVASCKGIRTPRDDTKELFIRIEAFPGGAGNIITQIHELDVTDKHALLTPVFGLTSLRNCAIIRPGGGREDWDSISVPYTEEFLDRGGKVIIEPFGEGRFERNGNAQATFDVLFGDLDSVFGLRPAMPILDEFSAKVLGILADIEAAVRNRP
jgi:hypothetical protein